MAERLVSSSSLGLLHSADSLYRDAWLRSSGISRRRGDFLRSDRRYWRINRRSSDGLRALQRDCLLNPSCQYSRRVVIELSLIESTQKRRDLLTFAGQLDSRVAGNESEGESYRSAMPSRILEIVAADGSTVAKGDPILIMESMKTVSTPPLLDVIRSFCVNRKFESLRRRRERSRCSSSRVRCARRGRCCVK